jgi:hypothetical protein
MEDASVTCMPQLTQSHPNLVVVFLCSRPANGGTLIAMTSPLTLPLPCCEQAWPHNASPQHITAQHVSLSASRVRPPVQVYMCASTTSMLSAAKATAVAGCSVCAGARR